MGNLDSGGEGEAGELKRSSDGLHDAGRDGIGHIALVLVGSVGVDGNEEAVAVDSVERVTTAGLEHIKGVLLVDVGNGVLDNHSVIINGDETIQGTVNLLDTLVLVFPDHDHGLLVGLKSVGKVKVEDHPVAGKAGDTGKLSREVVLEFGAGVGITKEFAHKGLGSTGVHDHTLAIKVGSSLPVGEESLQDKNLGLGGHDQGGPENTSVLVPLLVANVKGLGINVSVKVIPREGILGEHIVDKIVKQDPVLHGVGI